ncbi:MAG: hypothetical protein HY323_00655 [Betaproteobacteria bacterium]|nr:hypothetical protein [Betaproteobacteria bacterium]
MTAEMIQMGGLVALVVLCLVTASAAGYLVLALRAIRREQEETRRVLATMDWSVMLLNVVQQSKEAVRLLDTIDKRLQKLEAIEKVQLSHIDWRAGR